MKYKNIIVPVLFLIVTVVIIDRIFVANPQMLPNVSHTNGSYGLDNQDGSDGDENAITYFCKEGVLTAEFNNAGNASNLGLTLSDGRSFILPQVMSGSGIRYEANGMVFIGKGDSAMVQENGNTVFSDCIAGNIVTDSGVAGPLPKYAFTDEAKTFTFSYPKAFTLVGDAIGMTQQWRANATTNGDRLVTVIIPRSFMPKTNFSEATFTVGTSADPQSMELCLRASNGEVEASPVANTANPVSSGQVKINGISFSKYTLGDAATGNYYDTTSYRTKRNGLCYAVEYTIHSTNIGNYDPSQGITEFDRAKIQGLLEEIVQSFKFL